MKKIVFVIFGICIAIGIVSFIWLHGIVNKIFIPQARMATAAPNSIQEYLNNKDPINLILLGYGGGNHDGAYLTDSMIAVHIDPHAKKIFLVSIPRDIWIKIPTDGTDGSYSKINAAYEIGLDDTNYPNKQQQFTGADGGGKMAEYIVSQVTGLPINYFIGMDFSGFTNTIDTLGGVDLTVQKTFDDYQYPIEGKENDTCGHTPEEIASLSAQLASSSATISELDAFPCRYEHIHFTAGPQHMDGNTALQYVRSRQSLQDGTDFGRAQRQRNLIVAFKQKIFSASFIPEIIPFMSSLGDDLRTDLTLNDIKTFIQNIQAFNKYEINSLAITDQNFLKDAVSSDGQDILISRDGVDNWDSVHNWLTNVFSDKSQPLEAIIQVENGSGTVGLAQLATSRLSDAHMQVLTPTNAPKTIQQTTITVYDKNVNQATLNALKKEFNVNTITYGSSKGSIYNILIVVGVDYNQKVGRKLLNEP